MMPNGIDLSFLFILSSYSSSTEYQSLMGAKSWVQSAFLPLHNCNGAPANKAYAVASLQLDCQATVRLC